MVHILVYILTNLNARSPIYTKNHPTTRTIVDPCRTSTDRNNPDVETFLYYSRQSRSLINRTIVPRLFQLCKAVIGICTMKPVCILTPVRICVLTRTTRVNPTLVYWGRNCHRAGVRCKVCYQHLWDARVRQLRSFAHAASAFHQSTSSTGEWETQ